MVHLPSIALFGFLLLHVLSAMRVHESAAAVSDVLVLAMHGAGDDRVPDGKLVVSGSHKNHAVYTLEGDDNTLLVFWSAKLQKWRLVLGNEWLALENRITVYTNDADTDTIPLEGWKSESAVSDPPPQIDATWKAVEKEPVSQQASPNEITADSDENNKKFEWIGLGPDDVAAVKSGKPRLTAEDLDEPTCELLKTKGHGCKLADREWLMGKMCKCKFVGPKPKTCDKLFKSPKTLYAVKSLNRFALFGKEGCSCTKGKGFLSECNLSPKASI